MAINGSSALESSAVPDDVMNVGRFEGQTSAIYDACRL